MKKLLLLGGGGEIGSAIKEKFIACGYEVLAPEKILMRLYFVPGATILHL